jgi:hypothetical protein
VGRNRGAPRRSLGLATVAGAVALCLALAAPAQTGDGYDLTWNTVDGGGGASTDGQLTVEGTAGQADAATVSPADGTYAVVGGFWVAFAGTPIGGCVGDCSGNGMVTVDEIVLGVNILLDARPLNRCPSFDTDGSSSVTVDELIRSVNDALTGCG